MKDNLAATKWHLYKLRLDIAQHTSDEKYIDLFMELLYLNRYSLEDIHEMFSYLRVNYTKLFIQLLVVINNVHIIGTTRKVMSKVDSILGPWTQFVPKEGDLVYWEGQTTITDVGDPIEFYVYKVSRDSIVLMNRDYLGDSFKTVKPEEVFPTKP